MASLFFQYFPALPSRRSIFSVGAFPESACTNTATYLASLIISFLITACRIIMKNEIIREACMSSVPHICSLLVFLIFSWCGHVVTFSGHWQVNLTSKTRYLHLFPFPSGVECWVSHPAPRGEGPLLGWVNKGMVEQQEWRGLGC